MTENLELNQISINPPGYWIGVSIAIAALVLAFFLWRRRLVVAKPNEWLLVIKNGKMKSAGIGRQALRGWKTQVVTFPSSIQRVKFQAQQVTREMQGLEVAGFVVWVVNREGDGPFRAYKYLSGLADSGDSPQASDSIARMAESIIRHQVANSTIDEVISQREELRNKIRSEMQDVVKGWGVWLETVEITDVKILSQALFEDLQAAFRQDARKEAERIRVETDREIANEKSAAREQQKMFEAQGVFEREKMEAKLLAEKLRVESENLEFRHSLEKLKQTYRFALQTAEEDHRHELRRREAEALEGDPLAQRLKLIESLERICRDLPLSELKLVQMGEGTETGGLIPHLMGQLQAYEDALHDGPSFESPAAERPPRPASKSKTPGFSAAAPKSGNAGNTGNTRPPRETWKLVQLRALVHGIDGQSRELLLKGEREKVLTIKAAEAIDLDAVNVGDTVLVEYWSHMQVEFREPTEAEKAEPLIRIAEGGRGLPGFPADAEVGPVMKEVVTVRAIDQVNQLVTVMGAKGRFRGVPLDDPARLQGLQAGEMGVLTFSEPLAVSLAKV